MRIARIKYANSVDDSSCSQSRTIKKKFYHIFLLQTESFFCHGQAFCNVTGHYALKFNAISVQLETTNAFYIKSESFCGFSLESSTAQRVSQHDVVHVSVNSHLFWNIHFQQLLFLMMIDVDDEVFGCVDDACWNFSSFFLLFFFCFKQIF